MVLAESVIISSLSVKAVKHNAISMVQKFCHSHQRAPRKAKGHTIGLG
jgi:hypothetical protein